MQVALEVLTDRMPSLRKDVERLFQTDETFREVCEEYVACVASVARIESEGRADEAFRLEYVALQLRLEGELLRYLEQHRA